LSSWHNVHVDSIGPWTIQVSGKDVQFRALTMLEPVTNLIEIVSRTGTTSKESAILFENHWLSWYPRPCHCIHDQGSEFKYKFQDCLTLVGIDSRSTSARTPTANSLIESTHKTIGQIIRTYVAVRPLNSYNEAQHLVDSSFVTAMHALRCASNESLGGWSPGSIVFYRDVHLDIPLVTDILTLQKLRQAKTDLRLLRANNACVHDDFKVNDRILYCTLFEAGDKAKPAYCGPYFIRKVHTNNTVLIELHPGVLERVSIRRIKPFR